MNILQFTVCLSHMLTHRSFIITLIKNEAMEAQTCVRWLRKKSGKEQVVLKPRKVLSAVMYWCPFGSDLVLRLKREHRDQRLGFSEERCAGWQRAFSAGGDGEVWWTGDILNDHTVDLSCSWAGYLRKLLASVSSWNSVPSSTHLIILLVYPRSNGASVIGASWQCAVLVPILHEHLVRLRTEVGPLSCFSLPTDLPCLSLLGKVQGNM